MLPEKVKEMLMANSLCCLGTVDGQAPYLSLMFYTYIADEQLLVMSSRSDGQKVSNLEKNGRAAILIHEDERLDNPVSMTLLGYIAVLAGEQAEKYKALHAQQHPLQSRFIEGEDLVILAFTPQRAVLADRQDQVTYWEK